MLCFPASLLMLNNVGVSLCPPRYISPPRKPAKRRSGKTGADFYCPYVMYLAPEAATGFPIAFQGIGESTLIAGCRKAG